MRIRQNPIKLEFADLTGTLEWVNTYTTHLGSASRRGSGAFLIVANIIPLTGAIFFGWNVFDIILIYWVENLIVGVFSILRILTVENTAGSEEKGFTAVFFAIHYGGFCAVHGFFVFSFLSDSLIQFGFAEAQARLLGDLKWAIPGLALSHGFSFFRNYLGAGENKRTTVAKEMTAPYPRMLALHLAIVLGAFAVQAMGQPLFLLIILVAVKTLADWNLHRKEHAKRAAPAAIEEESIEAEAARKRASREKRKLSD